jgi:predicted AAA+ superfamily ATPase
LEIKGIADSDKFDRVVILLTSSPFGVKVQMHELIGRNIEGNRYFLRPLSFRNFVLQVCQHDLTPDGLLKRELEILLETLSACTISMEEPLEEVVPVFKRMLKFNASLSFLFNIYLKTGGFPSTINDYLRNIRAKERERVKPEFYERFIELVTKDALKQGKSDITMQQVLTVILKKFGSRYDFRGLAEEIEEPISHPTVIDYVRLMEDNFLIHVLYAYDFSKNFYGFITMREKSWIEQERVRYKGAYCNCTCLRFSISAGTFCEEFVISYVVNTQK